MPTGYTYQLLENPDMSFKDFAWICARAMGAFVMQKDDSTDAPPKLEEAGSPYYVDKLKESKEEYARWQRMSHDERLNEFKKWQDREIATYDNLAEEARQRSVICNRMLKDVRSWEPPTPDHQGFKDFMIDQLSITLQHDGGSNYWEEEGTVIRAVKPETWIRERGPSLERDIERAKENLEEEKERITSRNRWKAQLVESIGLPSSVKEK